MNSQEKQVLQAVRRTPLASQQQIANQLGLSREAVAGHIMRLIKKGTILGKGYIFPLKQNIVVIGGANVDLIGTGSGPFLPKDSNIGSIGQRAGGVGRNIAETLVRLDQQVQLLTVIGNDAKGRWLMDDLIRCGLSTEHCLIKSECATSSYLAVNNQHGELQAAVADMAIMDVLGVKDIAGRMPLLKSASHIVIEANCSATLISWLARQPISCPISADAVSETKAPRLLPLLEKIKILKVNRSEAHALLQHGGSDEEIVAGFLSIGVRKVILSLGERGVLLATQEQQIRKFPAETGIISDTGAGDALFAGIIYGDRCGLSLEQQAETGMACAAITLASPMAVSPELTVEKIKQWMEHK